MNPPKEDLELKQLARQSYFNAARLLKDAIVLYENSSYPSSFFLAVSAIEELGKVKMIDHTYADMRLNNEVLGYPKESFIRSLFSRHVFYSHSGKHLAAQEGVFFSEDDIPPEFDELSEWIHSPQQERQKALYVDFRKRTMSTPETTISKRKALKILKLAMLILEDMEDMGLSGTYWDGSEKTKRKAKSILESLKRSLSKATT